MQAALNPASTTNTPGHSPTPADMSHAEPPGGATLTLLPVLRVWATGSNATALSAWLCAVTAGLGVVWRLGGPQVHSQVPLGEFGQTVMRRMRVVLVVGLVMALLFHGGNAALGVGLPTLWAPLGVALLVTARANTDVAEKTITNAELSKHSPALGVKRLM